MSLCCENEKIINDYLKNNLNSYGELRYACMIMNKDNPDEFYPITNYSKQWVDIYKINSYQRIDPIILAATTTASPFSWDDDRVLNLRLQHPALFNLAEYYNIIHGHTFVLHDQYNHLATLSLTIGKGESKAFDAIIQQHKACFQMLLIKTHDLMLSFLHANATPTQHP
ncbi:autoinducer binding domain-containing protein [Pantoea sp. B65]|uniref:autoinducer binding domain-containing protein n=1 Tax=Pantoea sp. B65 TaxID=2813359 RepID=UPI0039B683CB